MHINPGERPAARGICAGIHALADTVDWKSGTDVRARKICAVFHEKSSSGGRRRRSVSMRRCRQAEEQCGSRHDKQRFSFHAVILPNALVVEKGAAASSRNRCRQ